MQASVGETTEALLRKSPDCVIMQAGRWPALARLFQRSLASTLARSRTTDLLIAPPAIVASSSPTRCSRHLTVVT
jgi:hypothetical protein